MILASHAIAGAAIGRLTKNPILAFLLGLASHFALDAIPHWQYELKSRTYSDDTLAEDMALDGKFARDIIFIGADFFLGIFLSLLAFGGWNEMFDPSAPIIAGIIGGVLPDAMQFVFWKFKHEPLISMQKFHNWIHAVWDFDYKSRKGVALQVAIILIVVLVSNTLVH
jgi:hypothetical protein